VLVVVLRQKQLLLDLNVAVEDLSNNRFLLSRDQILMAPKTAPIEEARRQRVL
jgi:hypothetical protein